MRRGDRRCQRRSRLWSPLRAPAQARLWHHVHPELGRSPKLWTGRRQVSSHIIPTEVLLIICWQFFDDLFEFFGICVVRLYSNKVAFVPENIQGVRWRDYANAEERLV